MLFEDLAKRSCVTESKISRGITEHLRAAYVSICMLISSQQKKKK